MKSRAVIRQAFKKFTCTKIWKPLIIVLAPTTVLAQEQPLLDAGVELSASFKVASTHANLVGYLHPAMFLKQGRQLRSGIRSKWSSSNTLLVAASLPESSELHALRVPERLGGGLLLYQAKVESGRPGTDFYRAQSWTAALVPLVHVPFMVDEVFWGGERAVVSTEYGALGLDVEQGLLLASTPGPPVIGLHEWTSDKEKSVSASEFGVQLQSHDDGLSWSSVSAMNHTSEREVTLEALDLGQDRARGSLSGSIVLDESLVASEEQAWIASHLKDFIFHAVETKNGWLSLLQGDALLLQAQVRAEGMSYQFRRWSEPLAIGQDCFGLVSGHFYCAQRGQILSYEHQLRVSLSLGAGHRVIAQSGDTLLLSGECEDADAGGYCLVRLASFEAESLHDPASSEQGCSLAKQRRVIGHLAIAEEAVLLELCDSKIIQRKLRPKYPVVEPVLPKTPVFQLADSGEREQLAQAHPFGTPFSLEEGFGFWMARGDEFFGVQVFANSEVGIGPIQRGLARASFSQERAFLWGARGFAKESTDGGMSFQQSDYPHWPGEMTPAAAGSEKRQLGCSPFGCQVGQWLRLGWTGQAARVVAPRLRRVGVASHRKKGLPSYSCSLVAGQSLHSLQIQPLLQRLSSEKDEAPQSFPGFRKRFSAFAALEREELALTSMGIEVMPRSGNLQVRVSGPRGLRWGASSSLGVVYQPPFASVPQVMSALTPGIFATSREAFELLGQGVGSARRVQSALDLSQRGGVVSVSTINTVLLLRFNNGGVMRYDNPLGVRRFSILSVIEQQERALVLVKVGNQLRIWSLANDVKEVASFDLDATAVHQAQLVADEMSHLALFASGRDGLSLYPISQWQLQPPLRYEFLSAEPELCPGPAPGFQVDYESRIPPIVSLAQELLQVSHLRQKLRIGYGSPCVSALRGRVVSRIVEAKKQAAEASTQQVNEAQLSVPLLLRDEAGLLSARCAD